MNASGETGSNKELTPVQTTELVIRSDVPRGLEYKQYREYLRSDFFFSCAYCTTAETEAQTIRFTIDHYEPRRAKPQLVNEYTNLMYACNQCNVLKGDRTPTPAQQEKGFRFFRPDWDVYADHFENDGIRTKTKSPIGYYTELGLDLNRQTLRRLRELRQRASKCDQYVLGGILALRKFQIDQLPTNIKGRAAHSIANAISMGAQIVEGIDALLRQNAHSPLNDEDTEAKTRARERSAKLKQLDVLQPGKLVGPRSSIK